MSELIEALLRLLVGLIDGVIGIFGFLSSTERHLSGNSRVGESPMDREARAWHDWVIDSWHWIALALLAIAGLIAGGAWLL